MKGKTKKKKNKKGKKVGKEKRNRKLGLYMDHDISN